MKIKHIVKLKYFSSKSSPRGWLALLAINDNVGKSATHCSISITRIYVNHQICTYTYKTLAKYRAQMIGENILYEDLVFVSIWCFVTLCYNSSISIFHSCDFFFLFRVFQIPRVIELRCFYSDLCFFRCQTKLENTYICSRYIQMYECLANFLLFII